MSEERGEQPDRTEHPDQPKQPGSMREADVANGEEPTEHETGEEQARENRENDPPA